MFKLEGIEWLIYGLSILSIGMLGSFLYLKPKEKFKFAFAILKAVFLFIFGITSFYWIITFPYVGWTYQFSQNETNYSKEVNLENVKSDVETNVKRIKILERELEETHNELEAVAGRLKLFLNLAIYGLIYFCIGLGVKSFLDLKDKSNSQDNLKL